FSCPAPFTVYSPNRSFSKPEALEREVCPLCTVPRLLVLELIEKGQRKMKISYGCKLRMLRPRQHAKMRRMCGQEEEPEHAAAPGRRSKKRAGAGDDEGEEEKREEEEQRTSRARGLPTLRTGPGPSAGRRARGVCERPARAGGAAGRRPSLALAAAGGQAGAEDAEDPTRPACRDMPYRIW
ncbi:unnamed protein product, partial [Prorocentrum cordatum]